MTPRYRVVNGDLDDWIGEKGDCYAILYHYREDDKEWYDDKIAIFDDRALALRVAEMLNEEG